MQNSLVLAVLTRLPPGGDDVTEDVWGDLDVLAERVHELKVHLVQNPIRRTGHTRWNVNVPRRRVPRRLDREPRLLRRVWALLCQAQQLRLRRCPVKLVAVWSLLLGNVRMDGDPGCASHGSKTMQRCVGLPRGMLAIAAPSLRPCHNATSQVIPRSYRLTQRSQSLLGTSESATDLPKATGTCRYGSNTKTLHVQLLLVRLQAVWKTHRQGVWKFGAGLTPQDAESQPFNPSTPQPLNDSTLKPQP